MGSGNTRDQAFAAQLTQVIAQLVERVIRVVQGEPDIDKQIIDGRRAADIERRREIYRALNQMVVREAPLAPLFHERLFVIHKPEVRGLRTSLVPPPVRYNDVWIKD